MSTKAMSSKTMSTSSIRARARPGGDPLPTPGLLLCRQMMARISTDMTAAAAMAYASTKNQVTTTSTVKPPTPPSSSRIMINSIPIDLGFLGGLVDHPTAHDHQFRN
jgi:hypothetical protein